MCHEGVYSKSLCDPARERGTLWFPVCGSSNAHGLKIKMTTVFDSKNFTLRKHAYSHIQKISSPKTDHFQTKNSDIFHISAQNIDCDEAVLTSTHILCFEQK